MANSIQPFSQLRKALLAVYDPVNVIAAGNTNVADIPTSYINRLFVEITVAAFALDAFLIQGRPNGGTYQTLYSTGYITPAGILIGASGALDTLGIGLGWFILDVTGIDSVRLQASGNGGTSIVTIRAQGGSN